MGSDNLDKLQHSKHDKHKQDDAVENIAKELGKIYGDTFISPEHAAEHWKLKDRIKSMHKKDHGHKHDKRDTEHHLHPQSARKEDTKVESESVKKSQIYKEQRAGIVSAEINKKVKTFGYFPEHILRDIPVKSKRNLHQTNETNSTNNEYGEPFVVENIILGDAAMSDYSFGWNLDRIDQRSLPLDSSYKPVNSGNSPTAKAIHVYVVDTGVEPSHDAFSTVTISMDYPNSGSAVDCNGHGTHVASTVAGIAAGVLANRLKSNPLQKYDIVLHVIKVLDCSGSGTTFDVISGLLWIYDNVQYPAIVTMSLGSSRSYNLDNVVSLLISNKNVPVIAAAGNSNQDACYVSPAAATGVTAVGSTGTDDSRSTFSNYGTCVDLYCPGEDILGAYYLSATSYWYLSGTSMATPQTTGSIAAYIFFYQRETSITNAAMNGLNHFLDNLTRDVVSGNLGGGQNALCYIGAAVTEITTPTPPPALSESTIITLNFNTKTMIAFFVLVSFFFF